MRKKINADAPEKSGVYAIENIVKPGRPKYVGSAINIKKRQAEHFTALLRHNHCNVKLQRAYNKYGPDAFVFNVVILCPVDDLIKIEQETIERFDSYRNGYNLVPIAGSNRGRVAEALNIAGQRFGRLVAKKRVGSRCGSALWKCHCDCGRTVLATRNNLEAGTESCGCKHAIVAASKRTARHDNLSEYQSWQNAKARTTNSDHQHFLPGVGMCKRWSASFANFFDDMGNRPSHSPVLIRINNALGYHCGKCDECRKNNWTANCEWGSRKQQAIKSIHTRSYEFMGSSGSLSDWASELGVNKERLRSKLRRGWTHAEVFQSP